MTYKTQEIIAKCKKQFDLRLFEEIWVRVQEKTGWMNKIKKALSELSLRELIKDTGKK